MEDPLLRFHCAELFKIGGVAEDAERRCELALRELYRARNAVVHEGNVLLEEERSIYLAAIAVELLLLGLEYRQVALLDAAEVGGT